MKNSSIKKTHGTVYTICAIILLMGIAYAILDFAGDERAKMQAERARQDAIAKEQAEIKHKEEVMAALEEVSPGVDDVSEKEKVDVMKALEKQSAQR